VPAVLLDQVEEQAAQARVTTVVVAVVDGLVEPAVGQGRAEPRASPLDGAVPERVELVGVSPAAEVNGQSGEASQSTASHGAPGDPPRSLVLK